MVKLAFTDRSTDEDQFVVEQADLSDSAHPKPFIEIARIPGTAVGESGGRVYFTDFPGYRLLAYRVRAANSAGESDPSDVVQIAGQQFNDRGLGGAFFNNETFSGPAVVDIEAGNQSYETWGERAPRTGIDADHFSAVFEGSVIPEFNERYTFYTASADGIALTLIDPLTDQVLLNFDNLAARREMPAQGFQDVAGSVDLVARKPYKIRIRYVEDTGPAGYRVGWSSYSIGQEDIPGALLLGYILNGPPVTGVFGSGSPWTSAFNEALASEGRGDTALGFQLNTGPTQLDPLPWTNFDRVSVRFPRLRGVEIAEDDLAVTGSAGGYGFRDFAYDRATHVATWTLDRPVGADRLLLDLDGDTGGVTDLGPGGLALDGEWVDGSAAGFSGDGKPGGDFLFHLNVLPGDADRNGAVNALDLADVKRRMNSSTMSDAGAGYSSFADVNGDGRINALDLSAVKQRLNTRLPAAQPVPAASPAALAPAAPAALTLASATKSFFSSDPVLGA